nr:hypothetical protein [Tanacetum cinerariifolium]
MQKVVVKRTGDVTRLQALVDKKRIMITEEVVREILQLDDVKGVICLPNDEIFAGLARMGSAMASALICLSSGQRFNFSKYIFKSLVRNVDSTSKFYMYPRFIQLIIQSNIDDLSKHTNRYISPVLTQKVFANMRRVGKGFSGVETPLFTNMLAVRAVDAEEEVHVPAQDDVAQENVIEEVAAKVVPPTPTSPSLPSPVIPSTPLYQSPSLPQSQATEGSSTLVQQVLEKCSALVLRVEGLENANAAQQLEIVKLKARVKKLERLNKGRISVDIDEGIELKVDQEKDAEIEGRQADTQAEIYNIDLDHSSKVAAASTPISAAKPAAKPKVLRIAAAAPAVPIRKRKGVKDQIEMDAEYAKRLQEEELEKGHEEAYKNIDWNTAYDHVQSKGTQYIKREEMEKEDEEIIKSINETPAQKAAKRRKQNEESQKQRHLEIVPNEDDDVFVEAVPLAHKAPIVDYQVVVVDNKPKYKIIRADDTHQFYISFTTLLKNFDREDLETLWRIVKDRFSSKKPTNFSDEYLLLTL